MSGRGPSRRALLGAAVGIPLVGEIGSAFAPPPPFGRSPSPSKLGEEWVAALGAFEAAREAVAGIEGATAGHSAEEEEALLPAHEAACDAMEAALGRAMLAAAPDWADFAVKLGLLFEHELERIRWMRRWRRRCWGMPGGWRRSDSEAVTKAAS
jgi:hypothetical protein